MAPATCSGEENIKDQSPVEEVALTVPTTDDPTLPVLTFRVWFLGVISCVILAVANQFFMFKSNPLTISGYSAQIAVLPLGHLMAATLPTKRIRFPCTNWDFSLNPGPFNIKEHVLITIFANAGAGGVYAISILTIIKAFYRRQISSLAAWLLSVTTQVLGFGWAGIFRKILVEASYMWWPGNLVQVSLFRALHEDEERPKGGLTRMQFFVIVLIASFSYYLVPNFLFPSVASLSVACWIWKSSVTTQQIGSGLKGLGIGSFALDWAVVSSYLRSPLATPWFAIANVMIGFLIIMYVIIPIAYWTNVYNAKAFPIFSPDIFTDAGQTYNSSMVLTPNFGFDVEAYEKYSKLHMSIFFAFTYGLSFATLSATISHVLLFHGKYIWQNTKAALGDEHVDVHTRLMRENYNAVPQSWFMTILVLTIGVAIATCAWFEQQLQLPWWGVLLACALAVAFTLPIGIITATTNMTPGMKILNEYIIGYLFPGRPVANVIFKTYGYITMVQAITFLSDFKLGHYMKIPPRSMFVVQVAGTLVAASVYFGTAWWLLESVENICIPELLPQGSPWTCPYDRVFYNASVIWGVVGPKRIFGSLGLYKNLNWFFLVGVIAPLMVWILCKLFPETNWIRRINMPVLIGATSMMPPATAVNFICWGTFGFIFNYLIFRRNKKWWSRHNYVFSAAMDAGVAFMGLLSYFALQMNGRSLNWWGEAVDDHCHLATCPTQPGIVVHGCPVVQV